MSIAFSMENDGCLNANFQNGTLQGEPDSTEVSVEVALTLPQEVLEAGPEATLAHLQVALASLGPALGAAGVKMRVRVALGEDVRRLALDAKPVPPCPHCESEVSPYRNRLFVRHYPNTGGMDEYFCPVCKTGYNDPAT